MTIVEAYIRDKSDLVILGFITSFLIFQLLTSYIIA